MASSSFLAGRANLALLAVAGITLVYALHSLYAKSLIRQPSEGGAFLLSVVVNFRTAADKESFKTLFRPLEAYVRLHEPQTLSYILFESDKDPLQSYIFERYADKDAYLHVHKASAEFIDFCGKLQLMIESGAITLDGHSYLETEIGFI